ncbi:hypothetical protein [Amycolatopsis panacis]|uniref:hypothetical protein n=1 Tax=Amycolatopsis panacis TaxID=2340917 RepID=UPI001F34986F|nr:hypothetical protein [Amycolatopsis panacis]
MTVEDFTRVQVLRREKRRHAHFRIVRVFLAYTMADLLRRPLFLQAVVYRIVETAGRFELPFLRATRTIVGPPLASTARYSSAPPLRLISRAIVE